MPLSVFLSTLLLQGFDVSFNPHINDDNKTASINVVIKKDDLSVQHIVNIPNITTGYGLCEQLYSELYKTYNDYNFIEANTKLRKSDDKKEI